MTDYNRKIGNGGLSFLTFNTQINGSDWQKVTFPISSKNTPDIFVSLDSHHNGDNPYCTIITDRTPTSCSIIVETTSSGIPNFPITANFLLVGEFEGGGNPLNKLCQVLKRTWL